MKVVFSASEAEPHLHLADRKLLSARFTRLLATVSARVGDEIETPAANRKFARDSDSAIQDVIEEHSEQPDEPPLDATLRSINDAVQVRSNGQTNEDVVSGRETFENEATQVSCSACSAFADRVCRGYFSDWKLFVDGENRPGGLCVNFIRELTAYLFEFSETWFEEHAGDHLRIPPEKVTIRLDSLGDKHDGTLPLDGSYNPDTGEMVLEWPTDPGDQEAIDEALLMLPYLIFHELFVHGGQGRALDQSIGDIPYDCAFTEGAVDAAARDLLITSVLPAIPVEQFRILLTRTQQKCKLYGEKRCQSPVDISIMSENRKKNAKIRNARSLGTLKVWEKLKNLELHGNRPATWKFRILTTLNLYMTLEQRDKFMRLVEFAEDHTPESRDEFIVILDKFLEDCQVNDLLNRLDSLGIS